MKKVFSLVLTLALAVSLLLTGGCAKKYDIPDLDTNRDAFFFIWDEVLPTEKIGESVLNNRAAEYPDELNLEIHPGILMAEAFTGPVFWLRVPDEKYADRQQYVPDMLREEYLANDSLPDGLTLETQSFEYAICGNDSAFASEEKLAALQNGDIPIVYALIESTGYLDGGQTYYYRSGETDTIYTPTWRVTYYSYPDGELLAWETADRHYQSGESISLDNISTDFNLKSVLRCREDGFALVVMEESVKLLMMD